MPEVSNIEELRALILAGIDQIVGGFMGRFLSVDERRLLQAERTYWQQADTVQLGLLLDLFHKEP